MVVIGLKKTNRKRNKKQYIIIPSLTEPLEIVKKSKTKQNDIAKNRKELPIKRNIFGCKCIS